ncbi:hypothetical protein LOTGIDRAFT_173937 [Lottia gigantea]|uniref:Uncharacterized protein n=1 Tax=Lottia gigantea TaxID=225164 RepID=V4A5A1_LOTGI|nr:hypothetical protein LOTGIDRAFT_173937 [Lottia gigantea]ESO99098.1 hypothetical protein LOTGIDRAFT_173937 [Lottia gigantea]
MLPQTVPKLDLTLSNYKEHFQFNSPSTNKGKTSTATVTATQTATTAQPTATAQPVATTASSIIPAEEQNKPNIDLSSESESPKVNKISVKLSGEEGPSFISESSPFLGDENAVFPDDLFSNHEHKPDTSSVPSDTKPSTKDSASESPKQTVTTPPKKANCDETEDSMQEKLQKLYESSKQGWSSETGKTVTLAQLMLMCGKDKKLILEYDWCPKTVSNDNLTHKLANMLRRLAHLAATEFSDFSGSKSKSGTSKTTACSMCGTIASRSKVQTANKGTNTSRMNRPVKTTDNHTNDTSEVASTIMGHDISVVQCSNPVIANQMPLSPQNGVFRVPMAVPLRHNQPPSHVSQATVSQLIRPPEPKSNFLIPRKRKKQKNKSIIIQRTLLPKTTKDQYSILPTMNNNQQPLITNTTIPLSQPGGVITQPYSPISLNSSLQQAQPSPPIVPIIGISENQSTISVPVTQPNRTEQVCSYSFFLEQQILSMDNAVTTSTDGLTPLLSSPSKDQIRRTIQQTSPPNLSTLLDMSLPAPSAGDNSTAEKLLDIALVNSNSGFSNFLGTPVKVQTPVKSEPGMLTPTLKTPTYQTDRNQLSPPNPTLLKLGFSTSDAQWLNGESQDISLSSFLTETPTKKTTAVQPSIVPPHNIFSEHSQDSIVETSFQSMLNESSMDLVSKFAKLADHIVGPHADKT